MYEKPFFITEPVSNNAFSYEKRQQKHLYVPSLITGDVDDVKIGNNIVFEDFDDEGNLRSCKGLERFIKTEYDEKPVYIFDNHNHAFAFWQLEKLAGNLQNGALLIHVDQHKDTRIPDSFITEEEALDSEKIFRYTHTVLNVGNFIPAAQKTGLVKEIIFIDSERSIKEFDSAIIDEGTRKGNIILDIDLDFFAPELDYIGNVEKIALIKKIMPVCTMITFATSPFFIDQALAIYWLKEIMA